MRFSSYYSLSAVSCLIRCTIVLVTRSFSDLSISSFSTKFCSRRLKFKFFLSGKPTNCNSVKLICSSKPCCYCLSNSNSSYVPMLNLPRVLLAWLKLLRSTILSLPTISIGLDLQLASLDTFLGRFYWFSGAKSCICICWDLFVSLPWQQQIQLNKKLVEYHTLLKKNSAKL